MSRLTKKVGENYCSQSGDFYDLYNKLGKLEDLEEELGCPLEVLVKALIEGVYYEDTDNYMIYLPVFLDFNLDDNYILYYVDEKLLTKDYKKTWWLRKDKSE